MSIVHVHLPAPGSAGSVTSPASASSSPGGSPPAGPPPPIPTRPAPVLSRAPQAVVVAASQHTATAAAAAAASSTVPAGGVATTSPPASTSTSPHAQASSPGAAASAASAGGASSRVLSSDVPLHIAALSLPPSSLPAVMSHSLTPFEGANRHASFVLLAEFDILKGSQLKYQYPKPTNIKENLLAESMLPEGAHLRESDWTVSFLTNQMLVQAESDLRKAKQKAREKEAASVAAAVAAGAFVAASTAPLVDSSVISDLHVVEVETQSQGYLCMLNLVRTKKDSSVARGAIVKALALVTRHRFYHIFKPLLMLSLDQYFDARTPEDQVRILANLYHTINNLPLQDMPQLGPLARRLTRATRLRTATNPSASEFFNIVVKWGGGGTGTGTGTLALPQTPGGGGGGAPSPAASTTQSSSSSASSSSSSSSSAAAAPSPVATLPMRIPLCMESDEVLEASLTTLVNRFQESTMDIYTALLAEKRVIFLGYQQPAAICCDCVVSACLLVSPPVVGTIHRAFPYANLTNMDFLNVPGYIAGVTNPIFEQRNTWWDLLCNISNGTVTFSPSYAEELAAGAAGAGAGGAGGGGAAQSVVSMLTGGSDKEKDREKEKDSKEKERALSLLDAAFFSELIRGVQLKYGEEWIRCAFRDLTHHLLLLLDGQEQFVFDDAAGSWRHLHTAAHAYRLAAFARSKQGQAWRASQRAFQRDGSALREMDSIIRHHVRTLQVLSAAGGGAVAARSGMGLGGAGAAGGSLVQRTPVAELLVLYNDLVAHVRTREEVLELLAMLPESQGGLYPIALGLLHKHPRVRSAAVALLQRIDALPEGNRCVSSLNYFLLITYYRTVKSSGSHMPESSDQEDEAEASASGSHVTSPTTPSIPPRRTVMFMEPAVAASPAAAGVASSPSSSELSSIPIAASTPSISSGGGVNINSVASPMQSVSRRERPVVMLHRVGASAAAASAAAGAGSDTPSGGGGSLHPTPTPTSHGYSHGLLHISTHSPAGTETLLREGYNFPPMRSPSFNTPTPDMAAAAAAVPADELPPPAAAGADASPVAAATDADAVATAEAGAAVSEQAQAVPTGALHIQPEMSPTSGAVSFDALSTARVRSPTFHDEAAIDAVQGVSDDQTAVDSVSPASEDD